ncbi:hypothetical protein MHYP_G00261880 [Metynnis hypsauchen]
MVLALLLCVVGLLSVSGGSQTTLMLEAEPGDNVTLQCHNSLKDPSSYIYWFKQINTSAPEFLIFMLYSAHVIKRPHDFERVTVFVNSTTVSLIMREVSSADSGLYFCSFQRMPGQITFSSATLLQVKGLLSVSGGSQTTLMLEAEPGDNVTLQCHSDLIDLWSYIHWFKQINTSAPEFLLYVHYASQMVLYSEDFVSKGPGRITVFVNKTKTVFLMINEVNSADSGLYFCGIQTRYGHLTFSSATLLQVKDDEAGKLEEVLEAEDAGQAEQCDLRCCGCGTQRSTNLTEGQKITEGGDPGEDPGHAGGTISPSWPGSASESPLKSCTEMVLALLLCVVGLLSVSGGSQTTLMLEAEPGDNVTLQCHSDHIYPSSYIYWFKQINTSAPELLLYVHYASQMVLYPEDVGSKGPRRKTGFVKETKSVLLMINEVNSADSGLYFCGIQRMAGQIIFSRATLLQVKGLLSVSGGSQTTLMLEAEPGDNVTLQCHSDLIDLWSYIHWFKQINTSAPELLLYVHYASQVLMYSEDFVSKGPGRITGFVNKTKTVFLMINEVNSADSGLYFCGIQKSYGHMTFSSATLLQVKDDEAGKADEAKEVHEADEAGQAEEAEGSSFNFFFILTVIFVVATVVLLSALLVLLKARK